MSSVKWRQFCLGLNMLTLYIYVEYNISKHSDVERKTSLENYPTNNKLDYI